MPLDNLNTGDYQSILREELTVFVFNIERLSSQKGLGKSFDHVKMKRGYRCRPL